MSNVEQTHNLNLAECLRSVSEIGSTTVVNVCTGAEAVVPWGSLDWLGFGLISAVAAAMIVLFVVLVVALVRG